MEGREVHRPLPSIVEIRHEWSYKLHSLCTVMAKTGASFITVRIKGPTHPKLNSAV